MFARLLGIMPEKAMKMQAWLIVGCYMDRQFDNPTYSKWLFAGAVAGAATTVIGQFIVMYLAHCEMINHHYMFITNC